MPHSLPHPPDERKGEEVENPKSVSFETPRTPLPLSRMFQAPSPAIHQAQGIIDKGKGKADVSDIPSVSGQGGANIDFNNDNANGDISMEVDVSDEQDESGDADDESDSSTTSMRPFDRSRFYQYLTGNENAVSLLR